MGLVQGLMQPRAAPGTFATQWTCHALLRPRWAALPALPRTIHCYFVMVGHWVVSAH